MTVMISHVHHTSSHARSLWRWWSLTSLVTLCAISCGRDDLSRADDTEPATPWALLELSNATPGFDDSPLLGYWSGPGNYGGCIEEGSWQHFEADGSFRQINFDTNQCLEPEDRYVVACEGAWMPQSLDMMTKKSGSLLHACRAERTHPNQPEERYLESTFAIFDRDDAPKTLSTMAWLWQSDGVMVRTQRSELTYPPSETFPEPERISTKSKTQLTLHRDNERGPRVASIEDFSKGLLERGETERLTLVIEMAAQGTFSTFGVSEQGEERVVLPVEVRREDDYLIMVAELEGSSDFIAWSTYLQDRGINARYALLGAVFSLSFSRTLRLDVRAPGAWAAPGAWTHVEDPCASLEPPELLEKECARGSSRRQ